MILCPVCNTPLLRKQNDDIGAVVLHCRCCKTYGVEGSALMAKPGDGLIGQLRRLKARADDDKARYELMMTSDIRHPMWTDLSQ